MDQLVQVHSKQTLRNPVGAAEPFVERNRHTTMKFMLPAHAADGQQLHIQRNGSKAIQHGQLIRNENYPKESSLAHAPNQEYLSPLLWYGLWYGLRFCRIGDRNNEIFGGLGRATVS